MNKIHNIVRGFFIKDKKILLAFDKNKEFYFLPGGHIEYGETIFEALKREMQEELSVSIEPSKLLVVYENFWTNNGVLQHELNYYVKADAPDLESFNSNIGHLSFSWINIEDISKLKLMPNQLSTLIEKSIDSEAGIIFVSSAK